MILKLTPEQAANEHEIKRAMERETHGKVRSFRIIKKSIDARGRSINVLLNVEPADNPLKYENRFEYKDVTNRPEVIVVGSGPAGLFCALRLIELNIKPIIFERGKEILPRKQDIALQNRNEAFDEESNYCFGQGGAGTFSDGKLYTRSKKRGNNQRIFEIFHAHGAQDEILYEAHPHIGTDRLPEVIRRMCNTITEYGGEIRYNSRAEELIVKDGNIKGVKISGGEICECDRVVLATGHSARDVYMMLDKAGIAIEAKGFALGVRVEHPQKLIDSIQYHKMDTKYLPSASYQLVTQVDGRGVYSFCMCPGGHIVPASTEKDHTVVNGMSSSQRNSPFANSGIVVEIHPEDLPEEYQKYGALAGLIFRDDIEHTAFVNNGGGIQNAPAQRIGDFVKGKVSFDLPQCSYLPGIVSSPLHFWLPDIISKRLQQGFRDFDKKMHGFLTNEALIVGVESRSSSPIRIPRDSETLQHPQVKGLYPAGEGSGYAGGITSSAVDGERIAERIAYEIGF